MSLRAAERSNARAVEEDRDRAELPLDPLHRTLHLGVRRQVGRRDAGPNVEVAKLPGELLEPIASPRDEPDRRTGAGEGRFSPQTARGAE